MRHMKPEIDKKLAKFFGELYGDLAGTKRARKVRAMVKRRIQAILLLRCCARDPGI